MVRGTLSATKHIAQSKRGQITKYSYSFAVTIKLFTYSCKFASQLENIYFVVNTNINEIFKTLLSHNTSVVKKHLNNQACYFLWQN